MTGLTFNETMRIEAMKLAVAFLVGRGESATQTIVVAELFYNWLRR